MSEPIESFQPELPLEYPTYTEYTVTISKGDVADMDTIRTFQAKDDSGALDLIEGLRDTFANRDKVTWQVREMPENGIMYGLAPGGVVYEILVVPPIGTLS